MIKNPRRVIDVDFLMQCAISCSIMNVVSGDYDIIKKRSVK